MCTIKYSTQCAWACQALHYYSPLQHTICTIKYSIVQDCHVLHSQPVFLFYHCCSCHHLIILSSCHLVILSSCHLVIILSSYHLIILSSCLVILSSSYHLCLVWRVVQHYTLHIFAQVYMQVLQKLILLLIAPAMYCTTELPLLFSSFSSSLLLSFLFSLIGCIRVFSYSLP